LRAEKMGARPGEKENQRRDRSGFYTTDYRSEGYKSAAKKDSAAPAPAAGENKPAKDGAKPAPAKPESKAAKK